MRTLRGNSARHGSLAVAVAVAAVVTAAAVAVAALAGCRGQSGQPAGQASAAAVPVGSSAHDISLGGVTRSYIVYRPASLPAAAPLVVMLHGGFGSASQAEKSYHWNAEADAGHFLVAYPDGLNRAWNAGGGCCGTPGRTGADDIGFIAAMVSAIEHAVPVDACRVYATGISNGGIMAYDLACHTTIFAAIGPDSATELGGCPDPATLSVIAVHGTADKNIPYARRRRRASPHRRALRPGRQRELAPDRRLLAAGHDHRRDGDHLRRRLPRRAGRGAHHHRRGWPPVARRRAQPARAAATAHRPAIDGTRCDCRHLAVLRGARSLKIQG